MATPRGCVPVATVESSVPPTKSTIDALLLPLLETTAWPRREIVATRSGTVPDSAIVFVTVPKVPKGLPGVTSISETALQPESATTARSGWLASIPNAIATAAGAGAAQPELVTSTASTTVKSVAFDLTEPEQDAALTTSRANRRGNVKNGECGTVASISRSLTVAAGTCTPSRQTTGVPTENPWPRILTPLRSEGEVSVTLEASWRAAGISTCSTLSDFIAGFAESKEMILTSFEVVLTTTARFVPGSMATGPEPVPPVDVGVPRRCGLTGSITESALVV